MLSTGKWPKSGFLSQVYLNVSAVKLSRCWLCDLWHGAFSSLSVLSDNEVHPFELALSFRRLVLFYQDHSTWLCDDRWSGPQLSSQFFPIPSVWTQSLSHNFFSRSREWCPPLNSSPCCGLFFLVVSITFWFLGGQSFLVSVTEVLLLPSPALSTAKPCLSNPPMLGSASSTFPHSHSFLRPAASPPPRWSLTALLPTILHSSVFEASVFNLFCGMADLSSSEMKNICSENGRIIGLESGSL